MDPARTPSNRSATVGKLPVPGDIVTRHRQSQSRERDPQRLGKAGEDAASAYLERRGYRILGRNVRADGVELDVIAFRRGLLAFVEVKARRHRRYGSAADAVDARKRARLTRGASAWLRENRRSPRRVRFDVITCEPDASGAWQIAHWEGAFDAGD